MIKICCFLSNFEIKNIFEKECKFLCIEILHNLKGTINILKGHLLF